MAQAGHPRVFDRDQVINAVTALFWSKGYEPTSLVQFKSCVGNISPASFHAAFGFREALLSEGAQQHLAAYGQVMAPLGKGCLTTRDAIEQTLRGRCACSRPGRIPANV